MQPAIDTFNASFGAGPDTPYVLWTQLPPGGNSSPTAVTHTITLAKAVPAGATLLLMARRSANAFSIVVDNFSNAFTSDISEGTGPAGHVYRLSNAGGVTSITVTLTATAILYYQVLCVVGLATASPISVAGVPRSGSNSTIFGPTGLSYTSALARDFVCGYLEHSTVFGISPTGAHLPANISFARPLGDTGSSIDAFWAVFPTAGAQALQVEMTAQDSTPTFVSIAYKKA